MSQNNIRILADSLVAGTTVIASAKMAHVSKNTAMRYRRILLSIVEKKEKRPILSGKSVQIDETYKTFYGMLNGEKKLRGISRQKEGIAIGTDGKISLYDLGPGHPTRQGLTDAWDNGIAEGSTITHDGLHGYGGIFETAKPEKEIAVNSKKPEEEKKLNLVNGKCSGVQWFLKKHNGIRRKYLSSYLCWYEMLHNDDPTEEQFEAKILQDLLQISVTNT